MKSHTIDIHEPGRELVCWLVGLGPYDPGLLIYHVFARAIIGWTRSLVVGCLLIVGCWLVLGCWLVGLGPYDPALLIYHVFAQAIRLPMNFDQALPTHQRPTKPTLKHKDERQQEHKGGKRKRTKKYRIALC